MSPDLPVYPHRLRDSPRCASIAMMMIAPWTAPMRYSLTTFDNSMILPMTSRMSAPAIVPQICPTPP